MIEKPKKLNVKEIYLDGRKLEEDEYEEIIYWDVETNSWASNSYRIIPKPL